MYFHRGTSGVGGTLPATNATISVIFTPYVTPGQTNSVANTPLLTNFTMDTTIGATAQTSLAYATDNVTASQNQPLLRFVSEPLAAQSIPAQDINVQYAISQSNGNSAFTCRALAGLWRPSSGALVGIFVDVGNSAPGQLGAGVSTAEQAGGSVAISSDVSGQTAQAGDIIVVEIWRTINAQTMATSYTNTVFYDGTTEGSVTDNAGTVEFATTTLAFQGAGGQDTPELYGHGSLNSEKQLQSLLAQ